MERRDAGETSSSGKVAKKRKRSRGLECAAYNCSSSFYSSDGSKSGLHFFKFPPKKPSKQRWCNLIKRHDGKDDFKVTFGTYLCQKHFDDSSLRRNVNSWRLNKGAEPSLLLYKSFEISTSTNKRKAPT